MKSNKKLAVCLILVFLCFAVCLTLLDRLVIRDLYPELYVHKGMPIREVYDLMGRDLDRDLGSGVDIPQWFLPNGRVLTLTYNYDTKVNTVRSFCITPDSVTGEALYEALGGSVISLKWAVPGCLTLIALAEVLIYIRVRKKTK